jgi:integrase/recombinase XerD
VYRIFQIFCIGLNLFNPNKGSKILNVLYNPHSELPPNYILFPKKIDPSFNSPFAWILNDFTTHLLSEKGSSKNTIDSYKRDVRLLLNYLSDINVDNLVDVNQMIFTAFLKKRYESGLNANSVRRIIASIKAFFKFLKREKVVKINFISSIEVPKTWHRQPDLLTIEEIIKIIEKPNLKTENGFRDRVILEVLYGSGLRVSELCSLRVIDFRLPEKIVRVFGKGGKERLVPLTRKSIHLLCEYWHIYRPEIEIQSFAFTNPRLKKSLNRITIWDNVKKYAKQCNIEKNIYPHSFRHAFASHMLDNNADLRIIQELMGHSDISTTGIYLERSLKQIKNKFHQYHPKG